MLLRPLDAMEAKVTHCRRHSDIDALCPDILWGTPPQRQSDSAVTTCRGSPAGSLNGCQRLSLPSHAQLNQATYFLFRCHSPPGLASSSYPTDSPDRQTGPTWALVARVPELDSSSGPTELAWSAREGQPEGCRTPRRSEQGMTRSSQIRRRPYRVLSEITCASQAAPRAAFSQYGVWFISRRSPGGSRIREKIRGGVRRRSLLGSWSCCGAGAAGACGSGDDGAGCP